MSAHRRFAPVLRYLAEASNGMYAHPSRPGLHGGQEVWADPDLQFFSHAEAKTIADIYGGRVVKLRISAAREPVRKSNRPDLGHVPQNGRDAFSQGWDTRACPHDPASVAAMLWLSDWWRANAEAFSDHIGRPLSDTAGVPIGARDREGRPIHVGDTLSFDEREWGGPHEFTIAIEDGEIVMSGGGASDLESWCTIVRKWDADLG